MNRRGFFGRCLGLLGIPFVSRPPAGGSLRGIVPDDAVLRIQDESLGLPVSYFVNKRGGSGWKRVDLNDVLRKE